MHTKQFNFEDEIQRGILYLSKSSDSFLVQTMPMMKDSYFELTSHQNFYNILVDYYNKYKTLPSDDFIIEESKGRLVKKETIGEYKKELDSINSLSAISFANMEYYLDKVEVFAQRQAMTEAILESVELINKGDYPSVMDKVRTAMSVTRKVDMGMDFITTLVKDRYKEDKIHNKRFKTVFSKFNMALEGGVAPGELCMVVAPPGVGKSIYLANQLALSARQGHKVLYVSLEMAEDRVAQRLDSILTFVPMYQLKERNEDVQTRLNTLKKKGLGEIRIKQFPTKQCSISQLRAYIRQLENYDQFKPDLIVIDYLELLSIENLNKWEAQQELAEHLRGMATELKVPIWTATQTNREGKRVPIITDLELAESYGKIRVADFVFSINQTAEEFEQGTMRLYIIKNRNGNARLIEHVSIDYGSLRLLDKYTPPNNEVQTANS